MLQLFLTTVFPVGVAVLAGWVVGRVRGLSPTPLAAVGMDVLGPALLLAYVPTQLAAEGRLAVLALGSVAVLYALAVAVAPALGIVRRDDRTCFIFAVVLANFGAFGLPLVDFALGADAFRSAMAVLAILNIPTALMGIYLSSPKPDVRGAIVHTFRVPFAWAVVLGLVMGVAGVGLPDWLQRPAELLGDGAIPVMLAVLGIQLARLQVDHIRWRWVVAAVAMRLGVSPAVVLALAWALGMPLTDETVQAATLQLATPAGMTPLMFMVAFGRDGSLLAAAILVGTGASMLTVPMLVGLLP